MEKNININITANTTGVKSLKQELRETITALQQIPEGTAEFNTMAEKAAELKDRMAGVNEQVNALATGSKYEKVTKAFGEMGAGLADMDFDRVKTGADLFAKSAKAITFKDAIGSIKAMGQSMLTVGKAILTNPMFLLVGLIIAIGVGVVKLMDKLGLLKAIFKFIGEVVDALVQSIKDFLDWIGLTTFALEDAASKQQDALQKVADKAEEVTKTITTRYDREIELAGIAGEDTKKAETEKQNAIIKTQQIRYKALLDMIEQNKVSKRFNEEEIAELKKQAIATREAIEGARHQKKVIHAQEVQDDKKKNEEIQKNEAQAYKERQAKAKQFAEDRLSILRSIQDLELELMKDGIDKELKANELKYQRLIEDTKKNEKMLSDEKMKTIELLQEQERMKRAEINQKETDEMNASLNAATEARKLKEIEAQESLKATQQEAADAMLEQQKEFYAKQQAQQEAFNQARFALADGFIKGLQGLEDLLAASGIKTAGLQKTIALVQIATDTAKAISAVIAGATAAAAAGGPAAPFLIAGYVASGIGTVLSAVASAKKALQAAPSLGGSGGGSTPNITAPTSDGGGVQPSFNLFGQNNNANTVSAGGSQPNQQQITVQAVVSETEMTGTQNRILQYQNSATL
jgi:hypothetical protein